MTATRLRPAARKAVLTLHVSVSVALIGVSGSVLILALQLAIILTGAFVVRPSVQALIDRSADGRPLGSARWELCVAGAANLTFAVSAVALAVFKPGGRLRATDEFRGAARS